VKLPEPLKLAALFIGHILTGLVLFSVIAGAALLVTNVGRLLGGDGLSYYILTGFDGLGLLLFAADFSCIILFTCVQTILFMRDLVKYFRKAWKE